MRPLWLLVLSLLLLLLLPLPPATGGVGVGVAFLWPLRSRLFFSARLAARFRVAAQSEKFM